MTGRFWSTLGMPPGGSRYYDYQVPINVGAAHSLLDVSDPRYAADALLYRAVSYGVRDIQMRINEMGFGAILKVDGLLGLNTDWAIGWAQNQFRLTIDGQAGPITCRAMFWSYIKMMGYSPAVLHSIGGIAQHESGYDPGAVGTADPEDLGLVQINGPSHPAMTEAVRFDYHSALKFCGDFLTAAVTKYGKIDLAVAAYANPGWADQWLKTGNPPNPEVEKFVNFVHDWVAPF